LAGARRAHKRGRDGHTYGRERYTPSGAPSAKERGRALGGSPSTRGAGRETDLFITNIPNHERPEEIAGQRDPPHIAPIVQHVIVVV